MYLCCGVAFAAPLEPIKLKGVAPGMTLGELEYAIPSFSAACSPTADLTLAGPEDGTCYYFRERYSPPHVEAFRTLADEDINTWVFYGREDRLTAIIVTFAPDNYMAIYKALASKYGAPKISKQTVANRMNAKFENVIAVWRRGTQTLTATRYSSDLETSSLVLDDSKFQLRKKQPSKDL